MNSGGLTVLEAAQRLGVSRASIDRWCRQGKLKARLDGRFWIIDAEAVESLAQERSRWISHETAATVYGIPTSTVTAAVTRGELTPRGVDRSLPSLDRQEVEAWLEERRRRRAKRDARRREREALSTAAPNDGRVWLDAETVAIMLGVSSRRIRQLAAEERLPCTRNGRRVWFVREHIEEVSAARAFGLRQDSGRE